jgi:CubicO group peptidase (beta-lactamase class C family)
MTFFSKLSTFFLFVCIFSGCNSSAQKKDDFKKSIDSLIQNTSPVFNGVILIAQNGKTLYSKAHGFTNFESKKPLSTDSPFEIMSNSKQIAAVLVLLEVEKGKVNLNAPIKRYLPELKQSWADSVTVHQLLNHSHGITDLQKPLAFKPGTNFKYGNLSFNLIAQIVAFCNNKSYAEVADALFRKLKMNHTFFYSKDKIQDLVSGHLNTNGNFVALKTSQITPESFGADGVISTVSDLSIWNNNLHKGKILKPETYQLMVKNTILSQHNVFGKEKEGYGYGIRTVEKDVHKYVGHTGLGDGFSSVNLYFPESDVSLIVLENQMNNESALLYASEIKIKNILLKSNVLNKNNGNK